MSHTVDTLHHQLSSVYPKPLSFDPSAPLGPQQRAIREKYAQLLKMPEKTGRARARVEWEETKDRRFDEVRFLVETEPDFFVPCHMLLPKDIAPGEKRPAVVCLQGHSTGMHISLGRPKYPGDKKSISGGDRDFAIQAVARGYIAVAMEQRGFGELKSEVSERGCHHLMAQCLMTGRTLQGERIHDVICLVDALEGFAQVDMSRLAVMGNSGGGTTAYHAACLEPRFKVVMPSCSFNTYEHSILAMLHCMCNYVPDLALHMEMADLAMCIAPRPLLVVNGALDEIFPIETAKDAFAVVRRIYEAAGAPDNCRHIIGKEGHRFYAEDAWPVFAQYI
ncbi:MAG: alpha/beta hydrolase family protein [Eubacteriales bacterium]|nr:alpha/beta hydrolase family protein [Eubacteriales bacterium]